MSLDHFLLKGGHQNRAGGQISLKSGQMFYIFASFKQIWRKKYTGFAEVTVESDQGSKKKKKKKKN